MKRIFRKIVITGFVLFLLMQLYQPARNKDNGELLPSHITKLFSMPDSVNVIFVASCYDCHSNNTRYPWYSYIQPGRFIMERHIRNGKKDLNFSEFGNYSKRQQESKLKSSSKQVKSGDMPLASYILLHENAKLTASQRETVVRWVDTFLKNYE